MFPNIYEFYHELDKRITSVSASALNKGWIMYVNISDRGSKRLSSRIFKKINIVELFILQRKVISGGHKINELLREFIKGFITKYTPEAFYTPKVVEYYHHERLLNMTQLSRIWKAQCTLG